MLVVEPRSHEQYAYLRAYLKKYPDRVDLVNTIVAVYNLGALDAELCKILIANTERVLLVSGIKERIDTKPVVGTVVRRIKRKMKAAPVETDEDEDLIEEPETVEPVVKPVKVRKVSVEQQIYNFLKSSAEPISNEDLLKRFNLKNMHLVRNYISRVRRNLLLPDESIDTIAEHRTSELKSYQLRKRDA